VFIVRWSPWAIQYTVQEAIASHNSLLVDTGGANGYDKRMKSETVFCLALTVLIAAGNNALGEDVVQAGAGSYRLTRPQPCKALLTKSTRRMRSKAPSSRASGGVRFCGSRRSSASRSLRTLSRRWCMEGGLAINYPGSGVTANPSGIFGAGLGKDGDLKIGHSAAQPSSRWTATAIQIGSWPPCSPAGRLRCVSAWATVRRLCIASIREATRR